MQESLEASLVRIRTADGRIVGAGFLVGKRHILTCVHVVSQALGLPDHPLDPPQGAVLLDFPLVSPHTLLTASVVQWCPPLSDGRGDIAGLELPCDPPAGAEIVRFTPAEDVWKHDFSVLGFPTGYDDGVWATGRLLGRQATNWIQVEDVKAQGFAIAAGFSGAPVWDTQLQGVVGMVVAASRPTETRTAFVIPLDVLAAAWPLLTVPQGTPRNPYKGLRPFMQRDAADFFGREAVVEKGVELVGWLVTEQPARSSTRLLTILGPSGAGKSSLVMAGLLPQLQQGALPGSEEWVYLDPMVPGKHPLEALASILKPHFPDTSFKALREDLKDDAARGLHLLATQLAQQRGTRVVLLIDQGEELFTQTEAEEERQHFLRLLLVACSEPRGPLVVLLTLRADFYDRPMQYPELFHLIETQHLSLLAIGPDDLRRVVEQPAALPDVHVTFEGDLVNRLLADVQGQVGALPLLQFTLDQLFQRRGGRQLTLSAYRELGGVKGALARQAEGTYTALPSEEHSRLSCALFVRLIDPGATEQDTTRRRAALSEFTLDDPTQTRLMRETIDTFIAVRLLTTNEVAGTTTIEVSHEAVIREWPRLADWLREARDDIRLQQTISKDTAEWEQRNKPGERLYRGSQLKEAQAWARRNTPSGNEVAFLHAGVASRVRFLVSIIAALLIVVSSMGGASWVLTHQPPDPTRVSNLQDDNRPGSLRYAVNEALPKSTITFDTSLRGTILLTSSDLNIAKNLKILSPGAGMLSISGGESGHIVRVIQGVTVTISGLTFKGSKTTSGIIDNEGTLTLSNSIVSGNTSQYESGISNRGTLTLNNSTVSGNTSQLGAGISNYGGGTLTLNNSTVSGNISTGGSGGGIANSGTLTLSNSTVSDNTAADDGGGIANWGTLTLSNSIVSGNTTIIYGGGIFNYGADSTLTLTNSTVSSNTSTGGLGGGIANGTGALTITNSTVSDNTANSGGGIAISDSVIGRGSVSIQVMLLYCTVYGNTANVGGGIWVDNFYKESQVTMGASIVAENSAQTGPDITGSLTMLGYNLIGSHSGATFLGSPKMQSTDVLGLSSTV